MHLSDEQVCVKQVYIQHTLISCNKAAEEDYASVASET